MKYSSIFWFLFFPTFLFGDYYAISDIGKFPCQNYLLYNSRHEKGELNSITTKQFWYPSMTDSTGIEMEKKSILAVQETSYSFSNPAPTRNFVTETAKGLNKGEGHYQNVGLFGNILTYGLTDHLSIGGGLETYSLFVEEAPIIFVTSKLSITTPRSNIGFAIGMNLAADLTDSRDVFAGSFFGLATIGNRDDNFTIGLGYAFFQGDVVETPVLQVGGMKRVSEKFMIMTDHIFVLDNSSVYVAGSWTARYMTRKINVDLGVAAAYEAGVIPVIGFGIKI